MQALVLFLLTGTAETLTGECTFAADGRVRMTIINRSTWPYSVV
jgi:hypothetical protein